MKYVLSIFYLLLTLGMQASHLLGGEITYQHKQGNEYDVYVTLYRDCDDCKLGGHGGGSSTANCSDLEELYIRSINSTCGIGNIGSISLTRTGYDDITPICDSYTSKCGTNSSYAYGFEAHYYHGTVNFDDYSAYSGCQFHLFFSKSERSSSITTLTSEEDELYTYAMIDPWQIKASSPQFSKAPKILFNLNQSVYSNDGITANQGDSLSIKWATPLKGPNQSITYNSGYNANRFITPYCPGGNCSPDISGTIYRGIYLDASSGNYAFTPTGTNEVGTRVIEVEQWHKVNNTWQLLSVVRRDILTLVQNSGLNNNPKILADDTYYVCVGDLKNIEINATDQPIVINGNTQPNDTVRFNVKSGLTGLSVSQQAISQAPYHRLSLSITPTASDIGTHTIEVTARDNYCPEYGEMKRIIELVVLPQPTFNLVVNDLFCGNNELGLTSLRNGTYSGTVQDAMGTALHSGAVSNGDVITSAIDGNIRYNITFTDQYGCTSTVDSTIFNNGNSKVQKASIIGDLDYCETETTFLSLSHPAYGIMATSWEMSNGDRYTDDTLEVEPVSGTLRIDYELIKNGLHCPLENSAFLIVKPTPVVSATLPDHICYSERYALAQINASPITGSWSSSVPANNGYLDLAVLGNYDGRIYLSYEYTDGLTGCSNSIGDSIDILRSPEMVLSSEAVCGNNFIFKLSNTIERPYHYAVEDITWDILSHPNALISDPYMAIDLPNHGIGTYVIEATNTADNGCITKDTAYLSVDEGLELTSNGVNTICQFSDEVDLTSYLGLNAQGGGWSSFSAGDQLNGSIFNPQRCGTYDLSYTYDKYGCYDDIALELKVICRPDFQPIALDSICENYSSFTLSNRSEWFGEGVIHANGSNASFDPSGITGQVLLREERTVHGCLFDTVHLVNVLPPMKLDLDLIPSHLCEGETIDLHYDLNHGTLKVNSCTGDHRITEETISYEPTACDLANKAVKLQFDMTSTALCFDHYEQLSIPYTERPLARIPQPVEACLPYTLDTELQMESGNNSSITYQIIGEQTYNGTGSEVNYVFPAAGSFDLLINTTDEYGCSNSQLINDIYTIHPTPTASFLLYTGKIITLSEREIAPLNTSSGADNFNSEWWWEKRGHHQVFSNDHNPIYELPADTGYFTIGLTTTTLFGCSDESTQTIRVVEDVVAFIPNAFTPNDEGPEANQRFNIISNNVQDFHIQIFNKWGQMVFESFDINNSWDGTYMNDQCQMGAYIYSIKLTNKKGIPYRFEGTVNLIR